MSDNPYAAPQAVDDRDDRYGMSTVIEKALPLWIVIFCFSCVMAMLPVTEILEVVAEVIRDIR